MPEIHYFIQILERENCKINIEQDLNGFQVYVENPLHQTTLFEFDNKGFFKSLTHTPF